MRYVARVVLALIATLMPALAVHADDSPIVSATEIIKSSVQIVLLTCTVATTPVPDYDGSDTATCQDADNDGSGTIIAPDGSILTAAHVAVDPASQMPVWVLVSLTRDPRVVAEPAFFARAVTLDTVLDLAIMEPVFDLEFSPIDPGELTGFIGWRTIEMGDQLNAVELGDTLRLVGYPGGSPESITVETATVIGFRSPDDPEDTVGWFRVSPSLGPGGSGGAAVNDAGQLVGILHELIPGTSIGKVRPLPEALDLLIRQSTDIGSAVAAPAEA